VESGSGESCFERLYREIQLAIKGECSVLAASYILHLLLQCEVVLRRKQMVPSLRDTIRLRNNADLYASNHGKHSLKPPSSLIDYQSREMRESFNLLLLY
jgi:hypothetical protein